MAGAEGSRLGPAAVRGLTPPARPPPGPGNPETLPLFRPADGLIGAGPQPLSLSATDGNELTASRFLILTGTGRSLELASQKLEAGEVVRFTVH